MALFTVAAAVLIHLLCASPDLSSLDGPVESLMARWHLPGGAIAITKDERLVFARGYGLADKESGEAVKAYSLFRIGSVSKPVTAVAVLKLVEEGRLDLDASAFRLLDPLKPPEGAVIDPRLRDISVRHLLYHAGGWDTSRGPDPTDRVREAAAALRTTLPAGAEAVIRYMMGRPLDFAPGSQHAYANFGYCALGRVIEKAAGQPYEEYVRDHVLKPIGITRMRVGRTLREQRYPAEVCYYAAAGSGMVRSVLSDRKVMLPRQYGGYRLEEMDSYGGWVASVVDLARFVAAVDGRGQRPDLLKPETLQTMLGRPDPPLWAGSPVYYGMGWNVRPLKRGTLFYHSGALADSSLALIVCTPKGLSWAALFNSAPASRSAINEFFIDLDRVIGQALDQVTDWPEQDLFGRKGAGW